MDELEYQIKHLPKDAVLVKMRLNGNTDTLALVRRVIAASVKHIPLSASLLNDIVMATTEACTNVIKHAYHFDENKYFELELKVTNELFVVEVEYFDKGFDPEKIPVPNLAEPREGGLGVFIIKQIMDFVKYKVNPEDGAVLLTMVKQLASSDRALEA